MTLALVRGLWLWAATLALGLLFIIPLPFAVKIASTLVTLTLVVLAWLRSGRRAARNAEGLAIVQGDSLPSVSYRKPVVLVCGDSLEGLFGRVAPEQLAVRTTQQGCYLRVPGVEQLPSMVAALEAQRPDWRGQLSVIFVATPAEHRDSGELAGQLRTFGYQLKMARKQGLALPLVLVSYLQAARATPTWFTWQDDASHPQAREQGASHTLSDWQRDGDGERLYACIQVESVGAWLAEHVLPHLASRESRFARARPFVCAVARVPVLPGAVAGNLWQRWIGARTGLVDSSATLGAVDIHLPFPDELLHLLPAQADSGPRRRAGVLALWLFTLASLLALASSAWHNRQLVRAIDHDLQRYDQLTDHAHFEQRDELVRGLREHAARLHDYQRNGVPLGLGFGLYRAQPFQRPLTAAIDSHRPPTLAPLPTSPRTVRLDSLSLFATGSAELKPDSTKVLVNALVGVKAQPGWLIVIAGHTDATGSDEKNLPLSRARAAAVRDWMQRMGDIPDSCFAVQGFGASQPVASNDSATGRAENRRVDIRLVPEVGACMALAEGPEGKI